LLRIAFTSKSKLQREASKFYSMANVRAFVEGDASDGAYALVQDEYPIMTILGNVVFDGVWVIVEDDNGVVHYLQSDDQTCISVEDPSTMAATEYAEDGEAEDSAAESLDDGENYDDENPDDVGPNELAADEEENPDDADPNEFHADEEENPDDDFVEPVVVKRGKVQPLPMKTHQRGRAQVQAEPVRVGKRGVPATKVAQRGKPAKVQTAGRGKRYSQF